LSRPSKRSDILREGIPILHRHGYSAASVESITEAAGVPKGSFFNHFGSKEAFAGEAIQAYFAVWEQISRPILQSDATAKEKVRLLLEAATGEIGVARSYDGCMIGNMSLEVSNQSEALRQQLSTILERLAEPFETVIRQGQEDGHFVKDVPPEKLARFVVNFLQGVNLRSKVDRNDLALAEFREIVLAHLAR